MNNKVAVYKDKKGSAFMVQHVRCGCHECIFLTYEELQELKKLLEDIAL